ncbi:MAG: response regulator [Myxococcota bacterium]
MEIKRKILVVDDAPMFRELESLFLARSGVVLTAEDGAQALEIAHRERPDVIVTDLSMPGLRGDQLCRRVKADPDLQRTPVIIVTGRDEGEEHEQAVRAGADDVLEKPVNRLSLIQSVNHFLRLAMRGLVRVPLATEVRLAASGGEAWGRSLNISRGGMFVELEGSGPAPDTEIQLEFQLPDGETSLAPTAKVVWRRLATGDRQPGIGLQFLKLDHAAARTLDEFVYMNANPEAESGAGAVL